MTIVQRLMPVALIALCIAAPVQGAGHRVLPVLTEVPTKQKVVALTIDLGESATRRSCEALLNWLEAHNIKATFFLTGWFIRNFPDITQRIARHGNELGNHTDTHPHCPRISSAEVQDQLDVVVELLCRQRLAISPHAYFRPPYGEYNRRVVEAAAALGYRTVTWSVTTVDYERTGDAEHLASLIVRRTRPGAIILTHATAVSAEMVPLVVTRLTQNGYRVTTLSGLVDEAE
jgi:peptidoglycan/xylan/chitin deacetylase (PgdA/CDA1 family)